tara:strand:- start:9822 stop:10031 length:210 start_codon:yes stop_codon:yes gene_type:complete
MKTKFNEENINGYKFETIEEYEEWKESIINKIYYCNISMNNEGIKDAVENIANTLWLGEGENLIANSCD